jgi:phytoene dehydrogenase-like protein
VFPILKEWGLEPASLFERAYWQLALPGGMIRFDSLENVRYKLQCFYPAEAVALRHYTEKMGQLIAWLKAVFLPHPLLGTSNDIVRRILRTVGHPGLSAQSAKALLTNTSNYLESLFSDATLSRLLLGLGYAEMPLLLHAGMWYLFLEDYWKYPGGLYAFAAMLGKAFVEHGGMIHTGTGVAQILINSGRAEGIRLENGDIVTANYVISALDYRHTYQTLITNELTAELRKNIAVKKASVSYVTACLAVDMPMEQGRDEAVDHTYIFLDQGMTRGMLVSKMRTSSQIVNVYLSQQWPYGGGSSDAGEQMITAAQQFIPRLRERILYKEIWYPSRYEQEFGAYGGASAGWNLHYLHLLRHGFPGWKSQIPNLFHASQWTYSPGGVPAAFLSARQAARYILSQ